VYYRSNAFETGVETLVNQILMPNVSTVIRPLVEEEIYRCLNIERPTADDSGNKTSLKEAETPLSQLDTNTTTSTAHINDQNDFKFVSIDVDSASSNLVCRDEKVEPNTGDWSSNAIIGDCEPISLDDVSTPDVMPSKIELKTDESEDDNGSIDVEEESDEESPEFEKIEDISPPTVEVNLNPLCNLEGNDESEIPLLDNTVTADNNSPSVALTLQNNLSNNDKQNNDKCYFLEPLPQLDQKIAYYKRTLPR